MNGDHAKSGLASGPTPDTEPPLTNVVPLQLDHAEVNAEVNAERERVLAALRGDGAAFAALVRPHLAALYRIAGRACSNANLAEDAVQETLDIAFRSLGRYQPGTSLRAFLSAIAVRRAHTLLRAERRRRQREYAGPRPVAEATPEEHLNAMETRELLREVLAQMSERRRTAALLRLDGGLGYIEIAEAMNSTPNAAKALVHLASTDLRRALRDVRNEDNS